MSASRSPTRAPARSSASARFAATVLFPTPPLPLITRITLRTPGTGSSPVRSRVGTSRSHSTRTSRAPSAARSAASTFTRFAADGADSRTRSETASPSTLASTSPSSTSGRSNTGSRTAAIAESTSSRVIARGCAAGAAERQAPSRTEEDAEVQPELAERVRAAEEQAALELEEERHGAVREPLDAERDDEAAARIARRERDRDGAADRRIRLERLGEFLVVAEADVG